MIILVSGMWISIGIIGVLFAFLVIVGFFLVGIYNRLVKGRNRYQNAYAQIDVQLKRRYDLIPNLVETAKGYLKHENETLVSVIEARNAAYKISQAVAQNPGDPKNMKALIGAEAALGGAMGGFFGLRESYPDLKASSNMKALSEELTSTENKISFARQAFNDSVTSFNISIQMFPNILFAGMFGFKTAELFEVEDPTQREGVKVSFS